MLLIATVLASTCSVPRASPAPTLHTNTLGLEDGAIYIDWRGAPDDVSSRFRLRDPSGELVPWSAASLRSMFRFDPDVSLMPGTYALEFLHSTARGRIDVEDAPRFWHAIARLELKQEPPPSTGVTSTFTRTPSEISVEGSVPTSTLLYGIEVEGLGEVAIRTLHGTTVRGRLPRFGPCTAAYDLDDTDRFRLVGHGPGVSSRGDWSKATEVEDTHVPAPGSMSTDRVSWKPELGWIDASAPSVRKSRCGSLVLREIRRHPRPPGDHRYVPDDEGVVHSLTLHEGGLLLDGIQYDLFQEERGRGTLRGSADDLWVQLEVEFSHTTLLRIREGVMTERHVRRGQHIDVWTIEDGVRMRIFKEDGTHLVETHRGNEIVREQVSRPPTITPRHVNGTPIELPGDSFIASGGSDGSGLFLITQNGKNEQSLGRYELDGSQTWTVQLEATEHLATVGGHEGIVCARDECFDMAFGKPAAPIAAPRLPYFEVGSSVHDPDMLPSVVQPSPDLHLPEGELVKTPYGWLLNDGQITTPATPIPRGLRVQGGDSVSVRWHEEDAEVFATLECGGPAVGFVPFR